jgi:cellulose synthase/poly-beta-1,6-N-acetylglucosamine synthase-like glycosyltransferase
MYNPKISFVLPVWNFDPIAAYSLLCQTYDNVEVIIVHDGEPNAKMYGFVRDKLKDIRVKYCQTDKRYNDFGHTPRAFGLEKVTGDLVVISGADNYYIPEFCEHMIKPFKDEKVQAAFCNCLHNYNQWEKMECEIKHGRIDCGNFVTRTENAKVVGWKSKDHAADWFYIQEINRLYCKHAGSIKKINRILFVHN